MNWYTKLAQQPQVAQPQAAQPQAAQQTAQQPVMTPTPQPQAAQQPQMKTLVINDPTELKEWQQFIQENGLQSVLQITGNQINIDQQKFNPNLFKNNQTYQNYPKLMKRIDSIFDIVNTPLDIANKATNFVGNTVRQLSS